MIWYVDTNQGRRNITLAFRAMAIGWWVAGAVLSAMATPVVVMLMVGRAVRRWLTR